MWMFSWFSREWSTWQHKNNLVDNTRAFFTHNLSYMPFWKLRRRRTDDVILRHKNRRTRTIAITWFSNRFESLARKAKKACRSKRTRWKRWTMWSLLVVLCVYDYSDYFWNCHLLDKQDWINRATHFQDWGPKYGIAYLLGLEISQKKALKKKIHDCLLQIKTNDYPDIPTLLGQMQHIQNRP